MQLANYDYRVQTNQRGEPVGVGVRIGTRPHFNPISLKGIIEVAAQRHTIRKRFCS